MSVPQAMEWLIEHSEDPAIDTPLPGHAAQAGAGAAASTSTSSEAAVETSVEDEESRDELTEIFKKIRRKKEFRADARVCDRGLSMRLGLWLCCARKPGGLCGSSHSNLGIWFLMYKNPCMGLGGFFLLSESLEKLNIQAPVLCKCCCPCCCGLWVDSVRRARGTSCGLAREEEEGITLATG